MNSKMWIKRKRVFLMMGVSLLLVAACLFYAIHQETLHCKAMQVDGGYGYVVLNGSDTLILQPYIPVVGQRRPFATQEAALEAARLVCRKLARGESPALTEEELRGY